jgi:hypothetical protein
MIFMGSKVKACYFLDLQIFLQKNDKKGYCGHFGHLADFATHGNCFSEIFKGKLLCVGKVLHNPGVDLLLMSTVSFKIYFSCLLVQLPKKQI